MNHKEPRPRIRNLRLEQVARRLDPEEILDRYFESLELAVVQSDLIDARVALSVIMQKGLHDQQRKQFNEHKRKNGIGEDSPGA